MQELRLNRARFLRRGGPAFPGEGSGLYPVNRRFPQAGLVKNKVPVLPGLMPHQEIEAMGLFFILLHEFNRAETDDAFVGKAVIMGFPAFYQPVAPVHLKTDLGIFVKDSNFFPLLSAMKVEEQFPVLVFIPEIQRDHIRPVVFRHGKPAYFAPADDPQELFKVRYFPLFSSHRYSIFRIR
jgi:hypothetical protein